MAELYGQGVVNSLGNQIRSAGIRSSMERGGPVAGASRQDRRWPAHITADHVGSHVFTVDELHAMNGADAARAGQMLTGRTISISGTVVHPPRADKTIHLVGAQGDGFRASVFFPAGRALPRAGERIVLRGTVDRLRRTIVSIRNPQVVGAAKAQAMARSGAGSASGSSTQTATVQPDYKALRFRPDPAVTDSLAERFADTLAPALAPGRTRQELAALVKGGQLQDGFRKLLQPYGFSDRDVADVLASHLVMTWQVANDHSSQTPRSHVLAVRQQTREALARAGWVQAMDDADKQRFAETLSVGTMMIVGRYANGYDTKNRQTIDMAVRDVRAMARSFAGIDMTGYALTDQGLMPRRR